MREAVFILIIIAALMGFTAFRYRRQLRTLWGVWKMLKAAREKRAIGQPEREAAPSGALVTCPKCGKWVAESKAIRLGPGVFYCSRGCVERAVEAN